MQNYNDIDNEEETESKDDAPSHFFCKLTFGQFFTMMVLEIVTLCFVFYLGARYGNEYLKLDVVSETKREPIAIVTEKSSSISGQEQEVLSRLAQDALSAGGKVDLKKRVDEILARGQGVPAPATANPLVIVPEEQPSQPQLPQENVVQNTNVPAGQLPAANAPETPPLLDQANATQEEQIAKLRALMAANEAAEKSPNVEEQQVAQTQQGEERPLRQASEDEAAGVIKVKSSENTKYAVQVGSYPDVKEASFRVEEWKSKGYPAYMMIVNLGEKGQWYRVRVGAFPDKDQANEYLSNLSSREQIKDAFVVKNEQ